MVGGPFLGLRFGLNYSQVSCMDKIIVIEFDKAGWFNNNRFWDSEHYIFQLETWFTPGVVEVTYVFSVP